MAPHSRTLAWKIPWMEEPGRLQSMGSLRLDWATSLSLFTFLHWRRKWQPTQCSCLENPRDRGAWWAAVHGVTPSRTRLKRFSSSSSKHTSLQSVHLYHVWFPHADVVYSHQEFSDRLSAQEKRFTEPFVGGCGEVLKKTRCSTPKAPYQRPPCSQPNSCLLASPPASLPALLPGYFHRPSEAAPICSPRSACWRHHVFWGPWRSPSLQNH